MAGTHNKGKNYELRDIALNSTTDTPIDFNERFISSCTIQARTAVDIQLRRRDNGDDYFTIKSGTVFHLESSMGDLAQGGYVMGYLRAASGNPVAEIVGYIE